MDFFGIGAAIKGVAQIYFRSARCTGRTINLFESVKTGDRVYFANADEANRFARMCNDAAKSVECIVVPVNEPHKFFGRGTAKGRAIFDHRLVEEFYMNAIERCEKEIRHIEQQSSGYGEAHRETQRAAIELSKWRF